VPPWSRNGAIARLHARFLPRAEQEGFWLVASAEGETGLEGATPADFDPV
jgi:hypothetical protein